MGDATDGTKIVAATPSLRAANPTDKPWLPPEAATPPAAGSGRDRRLANAPLTLNDPVYWPNSSLNEIRLTARPKSPPSVSTTAVFRIWGRISRSVAPIRSNVTWSLLSPILVGYYTSSIG